MATGPAAPSGRSDIERGLRTADRRTDETKPAYKTTEFIAYIAMLIGVFITAAVVGEDNGGGDDFSAEAAWLYAVILTFGYMVSRGIAKSGSRHRFPDDHDRDAGARTGF